MRMKRFGFVILREIGMFSYLSIKKIISMTQFEELEKLVTEARADAEAFYNKGNKAAGTRLRKAMQEAKNKAQDIRKEVTEKKNEA